MYRDNILEYMVSVKIFEFYCSTWAREFLHGNCSSAAMQQVQCPIDIFFSPACFFPPARICCPNDVASLAVHFTPHCFNDVCHSPEWPH